jgi:hypothetical protein
MGEAEESRVNSGQSGKKKSFRGVSVSESLVPLGSALALQTVNSF